MEHFILDKFTVYRIHMLWFVSMSVIIIFTPGQFGYIQYILFYQIFVFTVMYLVELNSTSGYTDQSVEI